MTDIPLASTTPSRFRFSLAEMLSWMVAFSVYFGAIYWLGFFAAVFGAIVLACRGLHRLRLPRVSETVAIVGSTGLCIALFLPARDHPRTPAKRTLCSNNLKQLALALHNYHDAYGSFPPAYIADVQGRPMHSWRVLVLPFLEDGRVYDQYRFDEPWDGPNNRRLHAQINRVFRCPSDATSAAGMTNYVVVAGAGTVFPNEGCVRFDQITDALGDTLLVVEVHNSGIHWLEPRDLHVTQMAGTINPAAGQGISSVHRGANVVFADDQTVFLPDTLPAGDLRGMLTIDGSETVVHPK